MGLSHSLSESPILTLLLICHFFADFHFQSQEVADKKGQDRRFLLRHLIGVALSLLLTAFLQYRIWWILALIFLSHALLDFFKEKIAELLHLNRQKSFCWIKPFILSSSSCSVNLLLICHFLLGLIQTG